MLEYVINVVAQDTTSRKQKYANAKNEIYFSFNKYINI